MADEALDADSACDDPLGRAGHSEGLEFALRAGIDSRTTAGYRGEGREERTGDSFGLGRECERLG